MKPCRLSFAMNIHRMAITQNSYNFNSFCRIGDKLYAANEDGIHEIGGHNFELDPIDWSFSIGEHNLGSSAIKRFRAVYLSGYFTGNPTLRVITDNSHAVEYDMHPDVTPQPQRVKVAARRDHYGRYFEIALYSNDSEDFSLDSIEAIINPLHPGR